MPGTRSSKTAQTSNLDTLVAALAVAVLSGAAVWFFCRKGYLLYYGDAQAHLNIARRMIDSRTPGYDQIGTVWLPLPHLLMLPAVANDHLWRTGLAGAIPSAICFVIAATFLFASVKMAFHSRAAAVTATALFALNPNLLYLQSTPMTEPIFFAGLMALLYFSIRFQRTQSLWAALGAGAASLATTLTRYEGWFLIPFSVLFFLIAAKRNRFAAVVLFSAIAAAGPLSWLAHNWWYFGDFFEFYNGPHSAIAIQGQHRYPGEHNWPEAWLYFRTAVELCAGTALFWIGLAGLVVAMFKRAFWPLLLLALPGAFYVLSIHSAGTPIYMPQLWPNSYYNTRYGLALLPLAAFAAAALVALVPSRARVVAAMIVVAAPTAMWLSHPSEQNWITWKESEVNSQARRTWTKETANFLHTNYRPGTGIFTTFGDVTGAFAGAGIHLRETLTWDNGPYWMSAVARPELFLREEWAVAMAGDKVHSAVDRAKLRGPSYTLQKTISVKNAPVIEIYRRASIHGLKFNEDPIHESAR
jgi:hypothetical protein